MNKQTRKLFFPKSSIDFKGVKTEYQLHGIKTLRIRLSQQSNLQTQTRMPFICHSGNTTLLMNPLYQLALQPSQNEEGPGHTATIKLSPQQNVAMNNQTCFLQIHSQHLFTWTWQQNHAVQLMCFSATTHQLQCDQMLSLFVRIFLVCLNNATLV